MYQEKEEKINQRTPLETVVPLESPYIMYIDPCGACNFKCGFCPCNNSDFMKAERHTKMSLELFQKIVKDMQEFKQKVRVVNLYAFGEPLLNEKLPEMITYLRKMDVCNEIRITTNGYCLTSELNNQLVESGLDLIRISLEALTAEDYQKLCGVEIDMEQYVGGISDLYRKSRGSNLKIAIKAVNSMIKDEEAERRFYEEYGQYADYVFLENVSDIWSGYQVVNVAKGGVQSQRDRAHKTANINQKCSHPLISMVIHSNGVVGACCVDWKFATAYGNVCEQSIRDIWHSHELEKFQIQHMRGGRNAIDFCKNCSYRSLDEIDNVAEIIAQKIENEIMKD